MGISRPVTIPLVSFSEQQACHPNLFVVGEVISQTALYSVCKGDLHMTYAFGVQGEGVGKFTEEQKFVNL